MIFGQLTDLHVTHAGTLVLGKVDTAQRLRACVTTLQHFDPGPELVVLSGDLTENGELEEYQHLRRLLEPINRPFYLMPGNHDRRAPLRAAFPDHPYLGVSGPINYCLEYPGLRLLMLDSLVEGEDWGELSMETVYWLQARLAQAPHTATVVVVHHPPIDSGQTSIDSIALRNRSGLGEIVSANPQIVAILSGHFHRALSARWRGTNAVVAPSTAQAIALDFSSTPRLSFTLEPPAFCLHRWDGSQLESHVVQAGEFAGPYPYD